MSQKTLGYLYGLGIIIICAIVIMFAYCDITAKLEICRIYYPEMSRYLCYMSDHLPSRSR